jgi:hypothetical protein
MIRTTWLVVKCRLASEEGVGAIVNLQEDSDMAYFDLDLEPIRRRCTERGDVAHNRYPIRDFDPFDLRTKLAGAVQLVAQQAQALQGTGKKVYIHCTAGALPAVCLLTPIGRPPLSLGDISWAQLRTGSHALDLTTDTVAGGISSPSPHPTHCKVKETAMVR